jgi:nucleotide-binding universal stress UspA family protein
MQLPGGAGGHTPAIDPVAALKQAAEQAITALKRRKAATTPPAATAATPLAAAASADPKRDEFSVETNISILPPLEGEQAVKLSLPEVIQTELAKGYGMLFLGIRSTDRTHPFGADVEKIIREFSGATAIFLECRTRTPRDDEPLRRILLPITGTEHSRVGAEVAVAIAKGCGAIVTALHVDSPPKESDLFRRHRHLRSPGRALTADVVSLGKREDVKVSSKSLVSPAKDRVILREANEGGHQLIVLGTKAWTGEHLHFGESVIALIEQANCPLLIVKS